MVLIADLAAASSAWSACFGKDGNFMVVVEEPSRDASMNGESSKLKRHEFKVLSFLLAEWSPVFRKMISSDNFTESQESQVVIQDFSVEAVGIFLRFLYCGQVESSPAVLVEVAALADKYQVEWLCEQIIEAVRNSITPEIACKIFALADRFRMEALRA